MSSNWDKLKAGESNTQLKRKAYKAAMANPTAVLPPAEVDTDRWFPTDSARKSEPGKYLAIDCEMVGVGPLGSESSLARVSIVNYHGVKVYDSFVAQKEKVTDYRTWVSGVREKDVREAPSFETVQKEVADMIKDKLIIGHAVHNDFKALLLSHPKQLIRDTATYAPLRALSKTKYPSLKKLASLVLSSEIQIAGQSHSSVDDARATMAIYRTQAKEWEASLGARGSLNIGKKNKKKVQTLETEDSGSQKVDKRPAKDGWWAETSFVPASAAASNIAISSKSSGIVRERRNSELSESTSESRVRKKVKNNPQ